MPTALLVDDEPLASARMRELLSVHPEIDVVGVATSVAEARAFLESRPPDVVFLDVEMPGGTGFDLLASVPDDTQVVFVTARERYAVQAFAAAALDYLVKPVDPERLGDKTTAAVLTVGDICWIESLRNYTRVALKGPPRVVLFRRRLSEWDECLPGQHFARVGRSCIVQPSTIDQIEWKSRAETTVTFGTGVEPLALGRLPAIRLREILGGNA